MPILIDTSRPVTLANDKYNFIKTHNQGKLQRDKTQSHRLHEPTFREPLIDSLSGEDISKMDNQPQHVDGDLMLNFVSEANRKKFPDIPLNYPSLHLPSSANEEDDRGG
ncbi:MAG: hypothetical protein PVG20_02745 [Thioalkalispiraceae bacterium]